MSKSQIKADAHAWLQSIMAAREVSSGQKTVAWCLVEFIHPHTARLCPSIPTIAARVALDPSVVRRHLQNLQKAGWITIVRSHGGAKSSTNAYALKRPTPSTRATPAPSTDVTPSKDATPSTGTHDPLQGCVLPLAPVLPDPKGTQMNPIGESARHAHGTPPARNKKSRQEDRGTRLTIETLPDEWAQWCRKETPILDPQATWERFSDYWRAIPGARGRKCDWPATWRNWCRKEADDRAVRSGNRVNGSKHNRQPGNDELAAWAKETGLGVKDGESWDQLRDRVLPRYQEAHRQ